MNRIIVLIVIGLSLLMFSGIAVADHSDNEKEIRNVTEESIEKEDEMRDGRGPSLFEGMKIRPGLAIEGTWVYLHMNFPVEFERVETEGFERGHRVPTRVEWEIWVDGERVKDLGGIFYPENASDHVINWVGEQSGLDAKHRIPIPNETDGEVNVTVTGATFDRTMMLETEPQFEEPRRTIEFGNNPLIDNSSGIDLEILGAVVSPDDLWYDRYDDFDQGPDAKAFGTRTYFWLWLQNPKSETVNLDRLEDGAESLKWRVSNHSTPYLSCLNQRGRCTETEIIPDLIEDEVTLGPKERLEKFAMMPLKELYMNPDPGRTTWNFSLDTWDRDDFPSFVANENLIVHEPTIDEISVTDDLIERDSWTEIEVTWDENPNFWDGYAEIWVDGEFRKYVRAPEEENVRKLSSRPVVKTIVKVPSSDQVTIEARLDGSNASTTIDLKTENDLESPEETDFKQFEIDRSERLIITDIDNDVIINITSEDTPRPMPSYDEFSVKTIYTDDDIIVENLTTSSYNLTVIGDDNITLDIENQPQSSDPPLVGPPSGSSDGAGPGFGIPMIVGVIFLLSLGVVRR